MKKIYLIGGAMGVGKTTVAQILKTKLSNSVFLDGDKADAFLGESDFRKHSDLQVVPPHAG